MRKRGSYSVLAIVMALFFVSAMMAVPAAQAKPPEAQNGTTLAAYKTIDICVVDPDQNDGWGTLWQYSGEIAVWNEGAVVTQGLAIEDCIQYKPFVGGGQFADVEDLCQDLTVTEIPAGTTMETATTFDYSIEGDPLLDGYIRNSAYLTILNHSGHLDTPWGPNPKATYDGPMPPPACEGTPPPPDCTYTQGYWGNKPGVVWPDPYSRDAMFFLSGQTWQQVLDTAVNVSQGYYQLAHQYIAAVLNKANGASVPTGVQDTLVLAEAWLISNIPSACTGPGSCGLQKTWAGVLDTYNNGLYPGGPPHCGDE